MSSVSTKTTKSINSSLPPPDNWICKIKEKRDRSLLQCQHNERISCHKTLYCLETNPDYCCYCFGIAVFLGEDRRDSSSHPAIYLSWFKVWKQLIKLNCYLILPLLLVSYLTIFKASQPVLVESLLEISKFLYLNVNLYFNTMRIYNKRTGRKYGNIY